MKSARPASRLKPLRLAFVADRTGAHRLKGGLPAAQVEARGELREVQHVDHRGTTPCRRVGVETSQALVEVRPEARLAHLAIRYDVEAGIYLLADGLRNSFFDTCLEPRLVHRVARVPLEHEIAQIGWSHQAASKRRQNSIGTAFHRMDLRIMLTGQPPSVAQAVGSTAWAARKYHASRQGRSACSPMQTMRQSRASVPAPS